MNGKVKNEIKQFKQFRNQLADINDEHDNVRNLEADDLIQNILAYCKRGIINVHGKDISRFFYENAFSNHDLYSINHSGLTKARIRAMLDDTIDAINGKTVHA